jgi:sigma-B regulation protein RsbU (phosphoserine phosphatase)
MNAPASDTQRPLLHSPNAPLRVLIADDDVLLSDLMASQLGDIGCDVRCAANGCEALVLIGQSQFDVLITDWKMPELDGIGLAQHLRAHPPSHYLHIIMMTTRAAQRSVEEALAVEVDAFIHKPVDQVHLELALGSARRIVSLERRMRRRDQALRAANARTRKAYARIKDDLTTAAGVQRGILPAARLTGDFRHAGMYLPCYDLGGDSYNVIELPDGNFLFFLVDICGHGVQAALRSFLVHHRLSALAPATPEELGLAIEHINDLAMRDDDDSYFTLVCGLFRPEDELVWLLRAGHPFPLLVDGTSVTPLDEGGPPIGLLPAVSYPVTGVDLSAGRRLLLYSDGITDCCDAAGRRLGQRGLIDVAARGATEPLSSFPASIERHLLAHYGRQGGFEDDLSMLVIECGASNARH